jgi:excisionase family DNA binding protein
MLDPAASQKGRAESDFAPVTSTGNAGLDLLADSIAARVAARLNQLQEPRLLSVDDAARYLGRTPKALRHMIAGGALPAVREGTRVHLDRVDLDRWVAMRKTTR